MVSSKPGLPEIALSSAFELLGDESSNGSWSLARARERATGRIVAIQRPVKGLDESRRARFSEEIAAAKELGHEGLVAVLAAGRDVDSGEWFCAVEPPSGVRLSDRLALGPLVEADLYALARRLAEALAHAHAKNLPLGGISPQNVLVTESGGAIIRGLGASRIGAPPTAPRGDDPYLDRDESGVEREPSFSGDLRSFGKLLFHAATGETPDSVALGLLPAWLRPIVARCIGDGPDRFARGSDVVAALLPLANRFTAAASHAGAARDVLSITLSPSRRSDAATPTPPSSATPAHLRATDGEGTPGGPFPWQPLHAQYDVEAQPRSGGMGTVLKARDRATGREVAIKRIRRDMLGSESVAQRFRREAKSIARLNHPHILSLLHCARDDDGDYLVLEWAEGGSLRDRLTRFGKLPLAEVIAIARKIGGALVHAHGKGVIHRDIKPHNVLLTEAGEPKLADFGLARGVGDLTAESSHAGAGTPLYIAPEQWKESRQADARSDLYSFAKMLYHLATGDAPSSIEAERIPRPLRAPLLGALRDRPEDRWPDVARFLLELERAVGSKPGFPTRKALVLLGVTIAAGAISAWLRGVVGDAVSDRDEAAPTSRRAEVSSDRDASPPADETGTEKAVAAADPAARGSPEATGARAPRGNDSVVTPGAEPSPTTPAPPPAPRPPADTAPPSIEYTATDGAPLPERVVTHAASFLFVAKAGDDVAVVEATQLVAGPGREPSSEPVSTMALRGGTTTEIALPSLGEHRFELRARDEAGNVTIRPLVIERRGDFPDSLDALFASITPRPGSKLATPNFELALALAPAMRDARVTIVPDAGTDPAEPPLGFDEDGKLVRAVAFAPDAARIAWTFRFEGEFRDAREVTIAYTFLRGRPPHSDASRFAIVEGAASEERYPRRIRHVATGIDLLLIDDLVVDGSPRAPFYVAPCEVSISEYRAFDGFALAKGGATLDRSLRSRHAQEAGIETPLPDWPEIPIQDVMPATFVSHLDAHAFCERFEFTLLDEPTWRALAGKFQDDGLYSNFASSDANAALKFTESCGPDGWAALAPTAIFRPERRGIRCLWGNVSEWLARDPDGSPTRAAGGSWIDRSEDVAKAPVVTLDGATRSAWIGFRVAYSPR